MLAIRYNKTVGGRGSGQYDIDTAVSHIISRENSGYTVCGIKIGLDIANKGGRWERSNYPDHEASCKRCIAKAKAMKRNSW